MKREDVSGVSAVSQVSVLGSLLFLLYTYTQLFYVDSRDCSYGLCVKMIENVTSRMCQNDRNNYWLIEPE